MHYFFFFAITNAALYCFVITMAWTCMTLFKTPKAPHVETIIHWRQMNTFSGKLLAWPPSTILLHSYEAFWCLSCPRTGMERDSNCQCYCPFNVLANCKTKDVKWLCYWQWQLRMFAVGLHSRERGINLRQFFFLLFLFSPENPSDCPNYFLCCLKAQCV